MKCPECKKKVPHFMRTIVYVMNVACNNKGDVIKSKLKLREQLPDFKENISHEAYTQEVEIVRCPLCDEEVVL